MSAIECKIIICAGEAENISKTTKLVMNDLVVDSKKATAVVKIQERYIADMKAVLKSLTLE